MELNRSGFGTLLQLPTTTFKKPLYLLIAFVSIMLSVLLTTKTNMNTNNLV